MRKRKRRQRKGHSPWKGFFGAKRIKRSRRCRFMNLSALNAGTTDKYFTAVRSIPIGGKQNKNNFFINLISPKKQRSDFGFIGDLFTEKALLIMERPKSSIITIALILPGALVTTPPGWAHYPARYKPLKGILLW